MTSNERDSVGESLERVDNSIKQLVKLLENMERQQFEAGLLVKTLSQVTLHALTMHYEALVLIESNLDDRLRKIENQLDPQP